MLQSSARRVLSRQYINKFSSIPQPISVVTNDSSIENETMMSAAEFRKEHNINLTGSDIEPFFSFEETPFVPSLKKALLAQGFKSPTPTQAQSWPIILQNKDLISVARTGSGKTCGFLLPAFHFISLGAAPAVATAARGRPVRRNPKLLVLAPTRELSVQIQAEGEKYARALGLRTTCLYGGVPRNSQIAMLNSGMNTRYIRRLTGLHVLINRPKLHLITVDVIYRY